MNSHKILEQVWKIVFFQVYFHYQKTNQNNSRNSRTIGHPETLCMELSPPHLFFIPLTNPLTKGFPQLIWKFLNPSTPPSPTIKPNLESSNLLPQLGVGLHTMVEFTLWGIPTSLVSVFQIALRGCERIGKFVEEHFFYKLMGAWGGVILMIWTFFKAKESFLWILAGAQ